MRTTVRIVLGLLALLAVARSTAAQSFTFSDGSTTKSVKPGDDFATTVVGDPWDFSQGSDYVWMFSEGWASRPAVSSGRLSGVVSANGSDPSPSLQIQFEGVAGALNLIDKNGATYPIDPASYNRLSFRMRRSTAPNIYDLIEAVWFKSSSRATGVGSRLSLSTGYDDAIKRYTNQSPPASQTNPDYHIYKLDLDTSVPFTRSTGVPYNSGGPNRGLRVSLGEGVLAKGSLSNTTIDVDWVRLSKRGAAIANLSWSGFGGAVTLTATNGSDSVQIFPDNDTNSTTFGASGTLAWDYGFLPPGTWTVRAQNGSVSRVLTLIVTTPPVINVTEPDLSGGTDFATAVIGDAWDLRNPEDVTRFGALGEITSPVYAANGLTASTTGEDSRIYFLDDSSKPVPNVDANTYRHLTFTVEYDRKELRVPQALEPDLAGVMRLIWRRGNNNGGPLTTSQDIFVLDGGPTTYSMDLGSFTKFCNDYSPDLDCHLEDPSTAPGAGRDLWTGQISVFRIDPFESRVSRSFRLADVRLTADDAPSPTGQFTIRWTASDASFSAPLSTSDAPAVADATVTLYYDTDTNPTSGLVRIVSGVAASAGQYVWNMGALASGRYFVYAVITDASGNSQGRYSTGPVRLTTTTTAPVDSDSDGDGIPDTWQTKHGVSGANADPDGDAVSNLQEYMGGTDPNLPNVWNLSEGATGFFNERLAIANPGDDAASIQVTFLRENGAPPILRNYTVEARRRITIEVNAIPELANAAVSVVVTATSGGVVVERTMAWDAGAGNLYGAHLGKAVQRPLTSWYLADGDAKFSDTYILFANAGNTPAPVTATYLLPDSSTVVRTYTVPANARLTVYANQIPGLSGKEFSTVIQSSVPITVERAMYFSSAGRFWNGGHEAAAIPEASKNWFVAEGRTGTFFDEFLPIGNPQSVPVNVTINFLRPGGVVVTRSYTLPPTSRTTIYVDGIPGLEDTDVSASIAATQPIVVERTMYWPDPLPNWYEAHNSAALTGTGVKWAMAEGEVGGPQSWETYVLMANPGPNPANVTLTFLRQNGNPVTLNRSVAGNSRLTVSAGEAGLPSGERFGVLVESTNGTPIVVEHAIYWNGGGQFWGAGMNESGVRIR